MAVAPKFDENLLERICQVLADMSTGLTGSEISRLLVQTNIADRDPSNTNLKRLYFALGTRQRIDGCGDQVAKLIQAAMEPIRYTGEPRNFENRRDELNEILAFCGYSLAENGKLSFAKPIETLADAEERAGRLRVELRRRDVHRDVLKCCRAELIVDNYFDAVVEAMESVTDRLTTEIDQKEHADISNLIKGIVGAFRSLAAEAPKMPWAITEQDPLDLLTIVSFFHRRMDDVKPPTSKLKAVMVTTHA